MGNELPITGKKQRGGRRGTSFKKGQSGNPKGRPKEFNEVKELARQWTTEAIERLAFWMRSDNPKASVSAAQAILDRGYGKPTQPIEGAGDDGALTIQIIRHGSNSASE